MIKHWEAVCFGISIAAGAALAVMACTSRQVAKTEYDAQSEACVKIYEGNAAGQKSCLDYVRNKWTAAGASAAALDGGGQ